MELNVIHLPHRVDRYETLKRELEEQKISSYKLWEGIVDANLTTKGISLAHKQIVRHARNKNLTEVLIAEDDIHFTAPRAFEFYLANKPEEFDIYLGGILQGNIENGNIVADFSGLTLYTIHHRFYDTFLSLPENKHIDRALRHQGKYVVCSPFVVTQHNGFSDNQKKHCEYDTFFHNRHLFR